MTRGELAIFRSHNRTLYYGTAAVVVIQLPDYFDKSEVAVIRSAQNQKGRWWRASFEELSAIPSPSTGVHPSG